MNASHSYIVSFDIGVKNLAYCVSKVDRNDENVLKNITVVAWEVENLGDTKDSQDLCDTLQDLVGDICKALPRIDIVLIENQPSLLNPVMKTIQVMLFTLFCKHVRSVVHGGQVKLVSAQGKTKTIKLLNAESQEEILRQCQGKSKYQATKFKSVQIAKRLLNPQENKLVPLSAPDELIHKFNVCKKKDDLADCLLQLIYFVYAL